MISLYSGTPGSGKSLHVAERIYTRLQTGRTVVANFDINIAQVRFRRAEFYKIENWDLSPQVLADFAEQHAKKNHSGNIVEGQFLLIIDECQILFNSRETSQRGRLEWCTFFAQHRKYGYDVILVAQFDRMIDRQIRALIEYEFIHRKVSNFGWKGQLLNLIMGGRMFNCKEMWYPLKEKIGNHFFRLRKRYVTLYDSYKKFGKTEVGGEGTPTAEVLPDCADEQEERVGEAAICQVLFNLTEGSGTDNTESEKGDT